jgi:hypothetical protein
MNIPFSNRCKEEVKMKIRVYWYTTTLLLSMVPGVLLAQSSDYHAYVSDNFTASLGAMRSSNSFNFESDAIGDPGDDIDFDDSLNVSDHSTFFNGQIKWKFGSEQKWALSGQYFSNNAKGDAILTEDIEWDGLTFGEGTFVEAGVKVAVTRLFVGRNFIKSDQTEFGMGIGLHNLDMNVYIEGEAIVDDETTGVQRAEVGDNQPLPNIGGWYNYSPAKKWLIHARVDWISANIGDYDGTLWNASLGVGYQPWRHVGFDLYWQYFGIDLKVDKDDWKGGANMDYSGPVLGMTFSW